MSKETPNTETFTCKQCNCELTTDYSLRTEGYCYLCDPAITIDELLSTESVWPEAEEVFSQKYELSPESEKKALAGIEKVVQSS